MALALVIVFSFYNFIKKKKKSTAAGWLLCDLQNMVRHGQIARFDRQTMIVSNQLQGYTEQFQHVHLHIVLDEEGCLVLDPQILFVLLHHGARQLLKRRFGERNARLDRPLFVLARLDVLGRQKDLVGRHGRVDVVDRDGLLPVMLGVDHHTGEKFSHILQYCPAAFFVTDATEAYDAHTVRHPQQGLFCNPLNRIV